MGLLSWFERITRPLDPEPDVDRMAVHSDEEWEKADAKMRVDRAKVAGRPGSPVEVVSAPDLLSHEYPPERMIVPGVLPAGFTVLAGAPKLGKSWLALDIAIAVARGDEAIGSIPCDQAPVLYLALEDTAARLQGRLKALLGRRKAPEALTLGIHWPRFPNGLTPLSSWCDEHQGAGLVVVDTWAKVRPRVTSLSYIGDYGAVEEVKAVADDTGTGIVMVHHTTKDVPPDKLSSVMGSQGFIGAADAILVLTRGRGESGSHLYVTGRNVEEQTVSLSFDGGKWKGEPS